MVKKLQEDGKKLEGIWIQRFEEKLIARMREEREARIAELMEKEAAEKREELKKAHWMCCPKCGHPLVEKDLENIKVDVCTFCEGIFFDRGELEELLAHHQSQNTFFRKLLKL